MDRVIDRHRGAKTDGSSALSQRSVTRHNLHNSVSICCTIWGKLITPGGLRYEGTWEAGRCTDLVAVRLRFPAGKLCCQLTKRFWEGVENFKRCPKSVSDHWLMQLEGRRKMKEQGCKISASKTESAKRRKVGKPAKKWSHLRDAV